MHDREHKIQQELILQVQVEIGTNDQGTSGIAQLIIPEKCGISKFPDEYGALTVRDEFVQSYEKGDRRANLTLGETNTFFFNTYEKDNNFSIYIFVRFINSRLCKKKHRRNYNGAFNPGCLYF